MAMELGYGNISKVRYTSKNGGDMRSIKEMLEDEDAYAALVDTCFACCNDVFRCVWSSVTGI